jgi:hypothetical protein
LGEELQNRAVAENRRDRGNHENPQIARIAGPNMPPHGNRFATISQQPIRRNASVRQHLPHKPAIEQIHA